MDLWTVVRLVGGLGVLTLGAEALVRGASRLAIAFGISPLVVGLTVVAFGTSAPEMAVSVSSGLEGNDTIAVANVVGSNVFNVLFILGLCAAIAPLVVAQRLVRWDVPLMIGASVLLVALSADGRIGAADGLGMLGLLVLWTWWGVRTSRRETQAVTEEYREAFATPAPRGPARRPLLEGLLCLAGLAMLVLGAGWFVDGAVGAARAFGVTDAVIGLTIVAAGTSMPEVATSVVATIRGERDIAIGNVVGSNLFNILGILGVASLTTPGGLSVAPSLARFDVPVMVAVAAACLPVLFTGHRISRWEGWLFLGYYAAYTAYLVMDATRHDALGPFSIVMWEYVLPLTLVTVAVVVLRSLREARRARAVRS